LGEHGVDDFLFLTRRGFCEHYAGAFTVLMRAAGVPARVVTGYQGGERNPVGGYWIVRQRDAHAWAEVWLAGAGWVRVDPTAAVAPERVEKGLAEALPMAERPLLNLSAHWLRPWRQGWDFLNNGWNQWVLGYDFQRQQRLLARLSPSLASLKGMLWAMLAGAGLILAGLALVLLRDVAGRPRTEAERLYARFLGRLERTGLDKGSAEGPVDFAARAGRDRPDLARQIHTITRLYIALRYGSGAGSEIGKLRRALYIFRPGRWLDSKRRSI
ncbi:MAG: transglutaminase domain-containing protein, partial [Hydrogenophilaceae bacterium]